MKYKQPKTPERDAEINHLIQDIQSQCKLLGSDKTPYNTWFLGAWQKDYFMIELYNKLTKGLHYDR